MKKRRGSAMVFVLIMVVSLTAVTLAMIDGAVARIQYQKRQERAITARYAIEGTVAKATKDAELGTLALGVSRSDVFGSRSVSATATDNAGTLSKTYKVSASTSVDGQTFRATHIIGSRPPPSVFYFTLATKAAINLSEKVVLGDSGSPADLYTSGDLTLTHGSSIIYGDAETVGTVTTKSLTIEGTKWENAPALTFPSIDSSAYQAAATTTPKSSSLNGYVFLSSLIGGRHELIYYNSSINLKGTFTGKGTIFVNGNLTIVDDVLYLLGSDCLVVIVNGNIFVNGPARNLAGYYYATGNITTVGNTELTEGALIGTEIILGGRLVAGRDDTLFNDSTLLDKLRVPGFWP